MRRLVPLMLTAVVAAACASNPYSQFYQGLPDERARADYVTSTAPLQVYSSNDFSRDVLELMRRGYIVIGQSNFNSGVGGVKESHLRDQASRVGAQLILVASRYTNTVSGVVPLSLPKTSTTTSTATATIVGSGGSATVNGTGTNTTTGTQTVMMPYSVERADFAALYLARVRTRLGAYVSALEDSTRLRLQSNFGVRIFVVVEGSPAFHAELLAGDILLCMGDDRVSSPDHYAQLLAKYQGKQVDLLLDRIGRTYSRSVTLGT